MKPYRVRVRKLCFGHYAIERRSWPWSFWRECNDWRDRTSDQAEAVRRAAYLLSGGEVIPHSRIAAQLKEKS